MKNYSAPTFDQLPTISVVTPSFNQGKYLAETLDSVLTQDYPKLEYIVIDGGSTDESVGLLKRYDKELSFWVSEPDQGQSHALNKGFSRATGDILCWLNSDDKFAPDALWQVATAFMTSKADMVAGICEIYEDDKLVHRHMTSCDNGILPLQPMLDLDTGWNAGQFFYQPEVFFSRRLWEKAGSCISEDYYYSMDYELWCRFAFHQASLHVIGVPLVHFRQHAAQKTAATAEFKKELKIARQNFIDQYRVAVQTVVRPPIDWGRRLKVAMINNLGFLYGAGIAHQRIAGAFDMAGCEVSCFDLLSQPTTADLVKSVTKYNPDIVIFGNLHDNHSMPIDLLDAIQQLYPVFWLTHDMWLITGRCGYFEDCERYLSGCNSQCPTANEYPMLASGDIHSAWQAKQKLLTDSKNITLLANSMWAARIFSSALPDKSSIKTEVVRLGVPAYKYTRKDRKICRQSFSITKNAFVLFFSVSSLSDERKGGSLLMSALSKLNIPNLVLLVVGRLDVPLQVPNARILALGYVTDTDVLVNAMNAADLYIGPSKEETFGQVFIEAAMCGLPSIGFDTTGVKDAIKHNITGVKVSDYSAQALTSAIEGLFNDPEQLIQLRKTASLYARNEFSLERSFASFFAALDKRGIIDRIGVAHKIALSTISAIIEDNNRGWQDYSRRDKAIKIVQKCIVSIINIIPASGRAELVARLPKSLTKILIRLLYQ